VSTGKSGNRPGVSVTLVSAAYGIRRASGEPASHVPVRGVSHMSLDEISGCTRHVSSVNIQFMIPKSVLSLVKNAVPSFKTTSYFMMFILISYYYPGPTPLKSLLKSLARGFANC
jgi:hypothetical protein